VAPLVGLFGTVVGIMFAFNVVSQAGLGKAELMADGINVALRTTAMGLTIAVPCILVVAWFNARIDGYMRDIDEALLQTLPAFARMEQGRGAAVSPKQASNGDAAADDEARIPISAK
jgi:biopolymer transport protein ExbB/TolQ